MAFPSGSTVLESFVSTQSSTTQVVRQVSTSERRPAVLVFDVAQRLVGTAVCVWGGGMGVGGWSRCPLRRCRPAARFVARSAARYRLLPDRPLTYLRNFTFLVSPLLPLQLCNIFTEKRLLAIQLLAWLQTATTVASAINASRQRGRVFFGCKLKKIFPQTSGAWARCARPTPFL
jgi:hypothetical protein